MSKCWPFLIVAASWFCFQTDSVAGICIPPMYGLDCNYTCHCYTSNCDSVIGCSGGCDKGWHGSNCNKENIALKQRTSQSSYFSGWWKNSSLAVDGSLVQGSGAEYCMFTEPGHPYTWWQVDLDKEYYIHKLAVHFRKWPTTRRNGVKVYSSLYESPNITGHLCGSSTQSSPDVTSVTCNNTARYITLYKDDDSRGDTAMNFCEVQVFVCAFGTFGDNCTLFCHCLDGPCDYITGVCTGGCQQNWTGITCSECDSDHYGPLCEKSCSSRHCDESSANSSCSKVTGRCDNGCTAGWTEQDCTKKCSKDIYGLKCGKYCSLRQCRGSSSCDHVTGKCDHGCRRGYWSDDCRMRCQDAYGFNCNMSCDARHCLGSQYCGMLYGRCTGGCQAGWELRDCTTPCQGGKFGPVCQSKCSERHCTGDNSSCDVQNGTCQYGCQPGWKSPSCNLVCGRGSYGAGCKFSCSQRHCQVSTASCNSVSGSCNGLCQDGWIGVDCAGTLNFCQHSAFIFVNKFQS
ncbi:multiple epidermal growth factor-like domains protein 10 [Gigantopelta aegis]|uniref:multiple epidermal growth factor-like domains protein 10 n=1 Tax=Gigantopelta aegis TaxID=1735272 RepID=UPI001B88CDF2|nr:multiple epidermal growth factor-like domains protein 10 [Gigantopelta aegis]